MKKKVIQLIIIIALLGLTLPQLTTQAEESTPSAVSDEEIKKKLEERMEDLAEKDLEEVRGEVEGETTAQLYAWVGEIEEVNDNLLSIQTEAGLYQAEIDSSASLLKFSSGEANQPIENEEIEAGQFAITMGPKKEDRLILAKRVIIVEENPLSTNQRQLLTGEVVEIDETEVTIEKENQEKLILGIEAETKLKISGLKEPDVEDIQIGDVLTAIVSLDEDEQVETVKVVLIVPGEANPQAEENKIEEEDIEATSPAEATPAAEL